MRQDLSLSSDQPGPQRKSVLYCSAARGHFFDLLRLFTGVPGCTVDGHSIEVAGMRLGFAAEWGQRAFLKRLHGEYFNLVVLDLRDLVASDHVFERQVTQGFELLDAMDNEPDIEARFGFHRVIVLVSGQNERIDRLIARLGSRRIGCVLRDPRTGHEASQRFGKLVVSEMVRLLLERKPGQRALCLDGGGITGMYFEAGVLKCLDDCLQPSGALNSFDQYFGISAGAVISGMLANGYTVDDFMGAIAGSEDGTIAPMSLSIFRAQFFNGAAIGERVLHAALGVVTSLLRSARSRAKLARAFESLFLDYSDVIGPPLKADFFELTLRKLFESEGRSNDFRELRHRLIIGATDQDLRKHVLFGAPGWDHVKISRAIQASVSLNPAFIATEIDGRQYSDGGVTSTSHVREAVNSGADLLFVVDPFVPYVSKQAGFVSRRGFLYSIDQDIRTLSFTRFEHVREGVLRAHPHVSSYTFLPANTLRRLMSVNPMDHRPYLEIWRGAYLSTLRRIQRLRYRMDGDLALHGLSLDTSRAEEVAGRLKATPALSLADFYVDGKIAPRAAAPPPALVGALAQAAL